MWSLIEQQRMVENTNNLCLSGKTFAKYKIFHLFYSFSRSVVNQYHKCASYDITPYAEGMRRVEVTSNFDVYLFLHRKEFPTTHKELSLQIIFEGKHRSKSS